MAATQLLLFLSLNIDKYLLVQNVTYFCLCLNTVQSFYIIRIFIYRITYLYAINYQSLLNTK